MFSLTLASLDLLLDGCNNRYSTHRLCFGSDKISPAVGNRVDGMSVVARWESEAVVVVSVVSPAAHCRFVCENLKEKQRLEMEVAHYCQHNLFAAPEAQMNR